MTVDQRANLVLAFAKSFYVNGQATEQMVDAAERLGRALGLSITIIPRWGELQLVAGREDTALAIQAVAAPAGVEMARVASTMQAIEEIAVGRLAPDAANKTIERNLAIATVADRSFWVRGGRGCHGIGGDLRRPPRPAAILIFAGAGQARFCAAS